MKLFSVLAASILSVLLMILIINFVGRCDCVMHKISNKAITVGIDDSMGSSISWLSDNNRPSVNLINNHDEGRYLQISLYSGPDPYRNAHWSGSPWPWNPISSGDFAGNKAQILSVATTPTRIEIRSIPLQWALVNVPCNCTFLTIVEISDGSSSNAIPENAFRVYNEVNTHREDQTEYGPRSQEMPALYTVAAMSELWTYSGSAPWSGGGGIADLTRVAYPVPGPPWQGFDATENWAAFTTAANGNADGGYGVGVFHHNVTSFLGGFAGTSSPNNWNPLSPDTGYIAPIPKRAIPARGTVAYNYTIAIGYLSTIRETFRNLKN
jgi:hypothetical protein